MNRFFASFALTGALILGAATAHAQQAPNEELRATHGDWEIRCISGSDTCAMSQVGKTSGGERALLVSIQRVSGPNARTQDGKPIQAAMTVQAPLGILIPYGVRIKIDGDKVIPLPLSRCIPAGCVSQAPMLDEAVAKMKKGSKAVYGVFLDKEVLVDISLRGFTKAYNNLKPVRAAGN
ncbi:MAG: invasion associated locus B family protein [Pseudomonadota bacterium]